MKRNPISPLLSRAILSLCRIHRELAAAFVVAQVILILPCGALAAQIMDLGRYGKDIAQISWCTDDLIAFTRDTTPADDNSLFPQDYAKRTTISVLEIGAERIRDAVTYQNAAITNPIGGFGVSCVRGGEYLYVSGYVSLLKAGNAQLPALLRFAHFLNIAQHAKPLDKAESVWLSVNDGSLRGELFTASDGSVFGAAAGESRNANGLAGANQTGLRQSRTDSVKAGGATFTTFTADAGSGARNPFPIYGLWTPEKSSIGSYDCPAARPGCAAAGNTPRVGYWFYTSMAVDGLHPQFVFTATPGGNPVLQRWPIVGKSAIASQGLSVLGVALDANRCFVLLQPSPGLASNRINGRLRLDLYLASCSFSQDRLVFDQPRWVARRQASFTQEAIELHGEYIALTESIDFGSQPEDQAPFEKEVSAGAKICVRLFRMSADAAPTPMNTICANSTAVKGNHLALSPNASYLLVDGKTSPLVIQTSYQKDDKGPAWLTNGAARNPD